uniref:NADH-ubiquinone oxidoreductase chain 4L n=1 Tax=Zhangixalus dennysi TaxID=3136583 RepID=A0A0H3UMP0_9NEOB|nr:NADH dehydrogenase subunit 4L [Rhacophorus dennysi]AIU99186.1 NADH dehydrogenase subunit 4L [Rhacophorus dennysi]ALC75294.1 NADH dehydrogenase subunit 4L [Rhacophorus dennysi]ARO35606.1 NADH dehydrogenase subunit 4L [Rhacophorus dennysi]UAJ48175.1 NADH dehydrogenase subunit 4L [Rhacophorus sp.]
MAFFMISMFSITLIGLSFHRTHLLSALLCLEGMMLTIFITMSLWPNELTLTSLMFPLVLLSLSACEAGLGLSLMIATARSHGSDNLTTLNMLQC